MSELPRRKLGGIDLPGMQDALANKRSKINSEICRLGEIKVQVFIERENRSLLVRIRTLTNSNRGFSNESGEAPESQKF